VLHLVAAAGLLGLSLGIDYAFALFVCVWVVALAFARVIDIGLRRLVLVLVAGFGVASVLRQVQVVAGVGLAFWATDFMYSVARRVPMLAGLMTVPSEPSLAELYREHGVVLWPGRGAVEPLAWAIAVARAYYEVVGLPFVVVIAGWAVMGAAGVFVGRRGVARVVGAVPTRAGALIASLVVAETVAGVVFGEYFAGFYGKALMPLPVHAIVPMLGGVTYVLVEKLRTVVRVGRVAVPVGWILLVLFAVSRIGAEIENHVDLPPRPYPGRAALRELEGHSVATLWASSAVSAYTKEWAASLRPRWWSAPSAPPFDPDADFHVFFQADRHDDRYRRPDFLFVPALNVSALPSSECSAFHHRISTYAVDCVDLGLVARQLADVFLVVRGRDYLLYDLRGASGTAPARPWPRRRRPGER
jgi:hypothetical protein